MQYQTLNRSCAYAGLANLLCDVGIHVEDRDILLEAMIPYFFDYDHHCQRYIAGPMLQGKPWFDIYLQHIGFAYKEERLERHQIMRLFNTTPTHHLIGIKHGNTRKHAMVFLRKEREYYTFLNTKPQDSIEPDVLSFTGEELTEKLEETLPIGTIIADNTTHENTTDTRFKRSLQTLETYYADIQRASHRFTTVAELETSKFCIFEALFLDVFSMMELLHEERLKNTIGDVRNEYIKALALKKDVMLCEYIDMTMLESVLNEYRALIQAKWHDVST